MRDITEIKRTPKRCPVSLSVGRDYRSLGAKLAKRLLEGLAEGFLYSLMESLASGLGTGKSTIIAEAHEKTRDGNWLRYISERSIVH
jgi:hypothetical protein